MSFLVYFQSMFDLYTYFIYTYTLGHVELHRRKVYVTHTHICIMVM